MKIALFPNMTKEKSKDYAKKTMSMLIELGSTMLIEHSLKSEFLDDASKEITFCNVEEMIKQCDILIAIGGDGTIINTAKKAAIMGKPILGINLGKIGFVAEVEPGEFNLLHNLVKNEYNIENRMMLDIIIKRGEESKKLMALNDAVISHSMPSNMVDIDVFKNEKLISNYRCDGLIISTPTGSTAYSFSAGGPIIEPIMDCIEVTPICAHSVFSRPIILDPASSVKLKLNPLRLAKKAFLSIDGNSPLEINEEYTLEIRKSKVYARFIKLKDINFFDILNKKLLERK